LAEFLYVCNTPDLGYRPFWLLWWVLAIVIGFTIFYFIRMKDQINRYISKKYEIKESSHTKRKRVVRRSRNVHVIDTFINCLYFSSMLLFSFRLKGELLTFFEKKQKWIIVSEYLIGILIYIAFLTLSKSGSILHTLKSLFVG